MKSELLKSDRPTYYRVVNTMPVVVVEMWAGRTEEQKAIIIRGITKVFEEIGIKPEHVQVILHEIPKSNWGIGGEQASKHFP